MSDIFTADIVLCWSCIMSDIFTADIVLCCSCIQFNSIQNSLFSTQHIVHTTMCFLYIRRVEKGTSRRQRLCGLVP